METLTSSQSQRVLAQMTESQKNILANTFLSFIESASTATGRATFYNTKEEQEKAIKSIHQQLLELDRSIYSLSLLLPGFMDYSKQLSIINLLKTQGTKNALLDELQEKDLIAKIFGQLSIPRKLKLFVKLRKQKINNARTRKLILRSILGEKNLERWVTKYKTKIADALEHAWGKRNTSIIKSILSKPSNTLSTKERGILKNYLLKYNEGPNLTHVIFECVAFVLGVKRTYVLPLLKAYQESKEELNKGAKLSYEVLEGIRSTYHKENTAAQVLELTKGQLTKGQKIAMQAKAKVDKVAVAFNPMDYDTIRLYLYAFKQGLTEEIEKALKEKAIKIAKDLPLQFQKIGILIDHSQSMEGNVTQWMRPLATTLAIRDVLKAVSKEAVVHSCGNDINANEILLKANGDTSLAKGLLNLLEIEVETIFILSDGYENTPAGRVNEVLQLARKIGVNTPVIQINPVMAAESGGVRKLSELITTLSVNNTEALGLSMLKAMFEIDIEQGVEALLKTTVPLLGK